MNTRVSRVSSAKQLIRSQIDMGADSGGPKDPRSRPIRGGSDPPQERALVKGVRTTGTHYKAYTIRGLVRSAAGAITGSAKTA